MKSATRNSQPNQTLAFLGRIRLAWQNIMTILGESVASFREQHASEAAASIAYYTLFSLFPLILILIVAGSYFLQRAVVQQQLIAWVSDLIPGSGKVISENIQQVLNLRSTFGLVAIISLLWSASGVFNTLAVNINHAWTDARNRSYVTNRMIALVMVGGLVSLSFIALVIKTMVQVLPFNYTIFGHAIWPESNLWNLFLLISPPILTFLILWVLYWWIPNTNVRGRSSLIGAITTTFILRLFSMGFNWYLGSGFGRYELVYGSLSTIVALMFFIYFSSWITLWGAHLTAAIDRQDRPIPGS